MNLKKILLIFIFLQKESEINCAPAHCNLFEPYEWIFDQVRFNIFPEHKDFGLTVSLRGEGTINTVGYSSNDEDCMKDPTNQWRRVVNPVQYLEDRENDFAAFLGNKTNNSLGAFSQQYSPYEGATANDLVNFNGNVSFGSAVAGFEKWFTETIRLGWYIPYYIFSLNTLYYEQQTNKSVFEQFLSNNILDVYKSNGKYVGPYQLSGFGDSTLLLSWQDSFFEKRDFITGLLCSLRGGLHLPTAQHTDIFQDTFLKIPMGYDAAWGIAFGGSIEVDIGCNFGAGISADCITFFGRTIQRYIKTDIRQTDLLLLSKDLSFIDPGFKEEFSVFLTGHNLTKSFLITTAYQYNKQNDSDIIVCSDYHPTIIASTMQSLGAWTTHNIILLGQTILPIMENDITCGVFVKIGFNGERTIVGNNFGLHAEILF
jgi:hypothetical protein